MTSDRRISLGGIFRFWLPVAFSWLMMAAEGPYLAAVIARMADAKVNLAAYGVAFAFAILVESPIIMIISASTALARDADSFKRLLKFIFALNVAITGVMLLILIPPVYQLIFVDLIGLQPPVDRLTYVSLAIFLPWPAAIGFRRFYQGVMIRTNRTRLVAYGTVVRLLCMAATALLLFQFTEWPGAYVGSAALSIGVTLESVATCLMARGAVEETRAAAPAPAADRLTRRRIWIFYYPLALTSIIGLAAHPMVTFFMGKAPFPLESLAVLPVVHSLSFIFRSVGLSYQEVAIAVLGRSERNYPTLRAFAIIVGLASSLGLAAIAFTPLAHWWYHDVSGLSLELTGFALLPTKILALMPLLSVLVSFQRALLVHGRHTRPVTGATVMEVGGIAITLLACIRLWGLPGATAASIGYVVGRLAANLFLIPSCLRIRPTRASS